MSELHAAIAGPLTDLTASALPYKDEKPTGAPDFYFAINATFRFIHSRFGEAGLQAYWNELGRRYFAPVSAMWLRDKLPGVARYWRDFFAAEPGADVIVSETSASVDVNVRVCPAIRHLRGGGREILPCFCQHCWFVGEAMAREANLTLRILGGNGSCRQTFYPIHVDIPAQQIGDIATAMQEQEEDPK